MNAWGRFDRVGPGVGKQPFTSGRVRDVFKAAARNGGYSAVAGRIKEVTYRAARPQVMPSNTSGSESLRAMPPGMLARWSTAAIAPHMATASRTRNPRGSAWSMEHGAVLSPCPNANTVGCLSTVGSRDPQTPGRSAPEQVRRGDSSRPEADVPLQEDCHVLYATGSASCSCATSFGTSPHDGAA